MHNSSNLEGFQSHKNKILIDFIWKNDILLHKCLRVTRILKHLVSIERGERDLSIDVTFVQIRACTRAAKIAQSENFSSFPVYSVLRNIQCRLRNIDRSAKISCIF